MKITKCDICKKTIISEAGKLHLSYLDKSRFDSFEFCVKYSEPIMKILKDNKLIKDENKKYGKK